VDFSSVGQVVGHRNCQPLFFVLVDEALAMAYARFGRESDLYVYEQADSLACLRCKLNEAAQRSRRRDPKYFDTWSNGAGLGTEFPSTLSMSCALTWPKTGM
jgi:hypothetical protein